MKTSVLIFAFLQYLEDGTVQLVIHELSTYDGGCYRCIAENDFGSDRTFGQVTIQPKERKKLSTIEEELEKGGKAPTFIKPIFTQRAKEGAEACFECKVVGNPTPEIRWLKDGIDLRNTNRIKIESNPDGTQRLIITGVLPSDDGYYCRNSNITAKTKSNSEVKNFSWRGTGKGREEIKNKNRRLRPSMEERVAWGAQAPLYSLAKPPKITGKNHEFLSEKF